MDGCNFASVFIKIFLIKTHLLILSEIQYQHSPNGHCECSMLLVDTNQIPELRYSEA